MFNVSEERRSKIATSPDDYEFSGSFASIEKQIGEAFSVFVSKNSRKCIVIQTKDRN